MTEHLSNLRIEELAAGLAEPSGHVRECPSCAERLAGAARDSEALRRNGAFEANLARLERRLALEPPSRKRWPFILIPAVALSSVAVVATSLTTLRHSPVVRLKGGPSLGILDLSREGPPRVGDRVALTVAPMRHPYALVVAVEESGHVVQLWPVGRSESGELDGEGRVRLEPDFEVTPGRARVWAFFSEAPLQADAVVAAVTDAATKAPPGAAWQAEPAPLAGESARARLDLVPERAVDSSEAPPP